MVPKGSELLFLKYFWEYWISVEEYPDQTFGPHPPALICCSLFGLFRLKII